MLLLIQLGLDLSGFFFFFFLLTFQMLSHSLILFHTILNLSISGFFPISLSSKGGQHLVTLLITLQLLPTNRVTVLLTWNNSLNMTCHPSKSIRLSKSPYLGLGWSGRNLSSKTQTLLSPATSFISPGGTPRRSQASWEIYSLNRVLGLS